MDACFDADISLGPNYGIIAFLSFSRMKKQLHAYFGGTVQGVGFRFTARQIADDLGVCGWVKNLRDGKVEIMAEADEKALQDFLDRINGYFGRYINDTDVSWSPASGEFKDFEIAL
jgi:acylphosphatase